MYVRSGITSACESASAPGHLGPQMSVLLIPFSAVEVSSFPKVEYETACFCWGNHNVYIALILFWICVIHIFSLKRTGWTASNPQSLIPQKQSGWFCHICETVFPVSLGIICSRGKKYIDTFSIYWVSTMCLVLFQFICVRKLRIREFLFPIIRQI